MPRPRSDKPYVCGPYKHRARFRLFIYTGASGPRGRRSARVQSFDTAEAARRWKVEFERQAAAAGRTVGDAVTEFLEYKRRKGNKERSLTTDRFRLAALLDLEMPIASLTARRAQNLYDELVDQGGAVDTHQGCLVQARALGTFCVGRSWLTSNPFAKVEPVGRKSRGKAQLRLDEARKFRDHCIDAWTKEADKTAVAAVLPFVMNLRASEVAGLVARDVDDRGRILWVAFEEDDAGQGTDKSEAARRRLEVPPEVQPMLIALAEAAGSPEGRLFTLRSGAPADRHRVADWAEQHLKRAGVRVVTTHGLRGTHSTLATEAGTSAVQLAQSMGHTDPGMTERHYIADGTKQAAEMTRLMGVLRRDRR